MEQRGTITQDADGTVQWKVEGFRSLEMNDGYWSPPFSCAGGKWYLCIFRVCPEGGRSGQRIVLRMDRYMNPCPRTLDVQYTFSVQSRDGHRHGEQRNWREFGIYHSTPDIVIDLEEERMSDLVPGDTITVLCELEGIDPTRAEASASGSTQHTTTLIENLAWFNEKIGKWFYW